MINCIDCGEQIPDTHYAQCEFCENKYGWCCWYLDQPTKEEIKLKKEEN